jgi:hypothetical protein
LGIDFIQQCWDKKIIPFCLPPHTTHLLQPLDVVCFQPLKHYHGEAIDHAVRTGDTEFTKVEFLAAFDKIRHQTFKESTVKSAFRKTGLIPYDPTIVINAMREYEPRVTPQTSPLRTNNLRTPQTFNEIGIMADNINIYLAKPSLSPSLGIQIGRFMKGAMAKLQSGAQAEEDLLHTQAAEAARAARKKGRNRVVQKGGVIYVEKARHSIKVRERSDVEKAELALRRAQTAERNRFVRVWKAAAASARQRNSRIQNRIKLLKKLHKELRARCG